MVFKTKRNYPFLCIFQYGTIAFQSYCTARNYLSAPQKSGCRASQEADTAPDGEEGHAGSNERHNSEPRTYPYQYNS